MVKNKTAIVVSYHFAPLNTMAAKRYSYMCQYFNSNGYDYRIISARPHGGSYLGAKLDLKTACDKEKVTYLGRVGMEYPVTSVIVALIINIVKKRGYISRVIHEPSWGWFLKAKRELDIGSFSNADCVVGTFPDIGNLLIACYLSRKLGIPFIADIRDLVSDYAEGMKKDSRDERIEEWFEKRILGKADALVTVTEGFSRILKARYSGKRIATIYNGWEYPDRNNDNIDIDKYLYFAGSLYEHRVDSLIHVASILKTNSIEKYVFVRTIGPDNLIYELRTKAECLGLSDYIMVGEARSESIVREEQRKAFINLMPSTMDSNDEALFETIPGKLFELLTINRPILAICSEDSEISDIIKKCKKGIATTHEDRIKEFILNEYKEYNGNEEIIRYSRKTQAANLCGFIDEILEEKR